MLKMTSVLKRVLVEDNDLGEKAAGMPEKGCLQIMSCPQSLRWIILFFSPPPHNIAWRNTELHSNIHKDFTTQKEVFVEIFGYEEEEVYLP